MIFLLIKFALSICFSMVISHSFFFFSKTFVVFVCLKHTFLSVNAGF